MKHNYFFTISKEGNGYCAFVPAFDAMIVEDNLEDLSKSIDFTIDTAIELCIKEKRRVPEEDGDIKTNGKIALRLPRSLHKKIIIQAKHEGVSMNQFIVNKLVSI